MSWCRCDAPPGSVVYFSIDEIDSIAAEFDVPIETQAWGRDLELTDPSGNRLRIGVVARS